VGVRILVVDDEPDLVELVRLTLSQAGHQVDTAASGRQALDALHRQRPDLLILDLMLPDLSGTELCRRIRADRDLAGLPVILLTAKADEVDRVVGFEIGADDYVTKPFSPRELVLRVGACSAAPRPPPTRRPSSSTARCGSTRRATAAGWKARRPRSRRRSSISCTA